VQSIDVLVIGSGEGRDGGLALRLARLGHRVVWAEAGELAGISDPGLWDVVAVDDSDDSVAPEDLILGLGRWDAPLMVVGADPRRAAGARPVVFCFREESDDGYARALHMCAALRPARAAGERRACGPTDLGPMSLKEWLAADASRRQVRPTRI
jgi:choline dehydrogenase-like flavoprotein